VGRVDRFLCARARASCRQTTAGCGWDGCLRCVWGALIFFVCASKSFLSADNCRLWLGWVFEVRVGRVDLFLCARARASCQAVFIGCGSSFLLVMWGVVLTACVFFSTFVFVAGMDV